MRKQTAPRIRKHRQASSTKQAGLIAPGNTAQQSATPSCTLANHSHRTSIRMLVIGTRLRPAFSLRPARPNPTRHDQPR